MKNFDVAIIGGGAAGLACAVSLSESNLNIAVIEAADRLGKKLAATGNGQGNISNLDLSCGHYYGGNVPLVEKIACKDPYDGAKLFDCLFLPDEKGRIYPAGRQASALSDNLISKIKSKNVEIIFSKAVKLEKGFKIEMENGQAVSSRFVVLCTGGKAQKQFKTDGSAYALATHLGHRLTKLYPSLVQLKTDTQYIKTLKGIRADCAVTAIVDGKPVKTVRGDVIFTEYGVSGNAIFSVSPHVTGHTNAVVSLEFLPDISAKTIKTNLEMRKNSGKAVEELLSGTLHNQLGRAIIKRANTDDVNKITDILKNFTLNVSGTLGFDYAQVTKGGIDMCEVTDELESKLVKNLFFAGEILDVDGDCGGYNLQWAFTSGKAAAQAILKR